MLRPVLMWTTFVLCALFLTSELSDGRRVFGDTARHYYRRAEAAQSIASMERRDVAAPRSSYRFYNKKSSPYHVKSLPLMKFELGEFYSGTMPIDESNPDRKLFFVFQPRAGGHPVDEVTIWLNGGPGCSSLEGFLQENGKFAWAWGMYSPEINPYSWVNLTNMLWVEYPVGTGFSTGKVTANTQEEISKDFLGFFKNFQKTFGIKNFKIYITGESYAGRYVPYISAAMLDEKDKEYYNVKGALVYDPCIGQYEYSGQQAPAVPFAMKNNNFLNLNQTFLDEMQRMHEYCGYANYTSYFMQFPPQAHQPALNTGSPHIGHESCDLWGKIYDASYRPNPCYNVYSIQQNCPLIFDPLAYPSDVEYDYPGNKIYFARDDVKKAMHAPMDVDWSECSGPVFKGTGGVYGLGDLSLDPIQKVLPQVIEATNRVLVANGDYDFEILTNGTLLSIQNMTWNGKMGFQKAPSTPIDIHLPDLKYERNFKMSGLAGLDGPGQGNMGIQHYERGLMWAETFQSGHMEPQFQPRSAYRHLEWVLGRVDHL